MALLPIVQYPDPRLAAKAEPVVVFDDALRQLAADMAETMYEAPGVGLAATQVGKLIRMVVIDISEEKNDLHVLINPEITSRSEEIKECEEGCLSLPGKWGYVKRPEWVKVKAQDRTGAWFEVEGTGLTARCFCHELSHLDGHLYSELCDRLYTSDELDELMEAQETEE